MWLTCKNCGSGFEHPKRYRRFCFVCGGDDPPAPWVYLAGAAIGCTLAVLLFGCRPSPPWRIDCRDGNPQHSWSFDCGPTCEEATVQRELAKCPNASKDEDGFIGFEGNGYVFSPIHR